MNTQVIGYVGENGTRDVQIPVGHLLEKWPDLSPSILMVPVGGADDDAYPVDSELVGSDLVWHVSAADTAVTGTTKASVRMTASDGRVALDEPFTVIVSQNLSAGGTPPSPVQPWVDKLAELAPRAEKAADDAAKAANRANDAAQNWEKGTAANASKLGGNPAASYALKTDTAPNTEMLGGKAPEYYLTPVNLLDNSNFANLVAQAGFNAKHGTETYGCDRWISSAVTFSQGSGHATLTTAAKTGRMWQRLPKTLAGKAIAAAAKVTGTGTVYVGVYYAYNGTPASISKSVVAPNDVVIFCAGTIPAGATEIEFRIYPAYDDAGGSCAVEWVAIYEGEYTAANLPPYVPKPYAVELAECQRYYIKIATQPVNGWCYSGGSATMFVPLPVTMRTTTPSVTLTSAVSNFYIGSDSYSATLTSGTAVSNGVDVYFRHSASVNGQCIMPEFAAEFSADMGKGE